MPYFLIDGKSVYDNLRAPKFHLLTFSDGESDYLTAQQKQLHELNPNIAALIDHHVIPLYPHVAEIFDTNKSFNVLLRPDNYIGFINSETSSDRVATYMKDVIGKAN